MKKSTWIYATLTILLAGYLVAATVMGGRAASERMCKGVLITVHDTAEIRFVSANELASELGKVRALALATPVDAFNLDSIERALESFDKIERATVNILTNDKLHIEIWPMQPVVRIFDPFGASYYINRDGKRIMADARYFLDLPVVAGEFGPTTRPPTYVLPVVNFIESDSLWRRMVSMVKMDRSMDLILVPAVRGHVVNLGDTTDLPAKFNRLHRMYTEVLPVKGWNYYDTISLKWRGQVVATLRKKQLDSPRYDDDTNDEQVDLSAMMVDDNVAAGQALAGRPANIDLITPGRKAETADTTSVDGDKPKVDKPKT